MEKPQDCILIIFGASGDLAKRKLVPALFDLFRQNLLPEKFALLGVSRTDFNDESFRGNMAKGIAEFSESKPVDDSQIAEFVRTLYYVSIDTEKAADYQSVKNRLEKIGNELNIPANYIFYLSTPPALYQIIPEFLGQQGLNHENGNSLWKRIIVEKPFGYDLESAVALNHKIQSIFREHQIYRIDHYLGKETVQNVMALRFANGIFEPLWNRNYVDHIEVTAAEFVGVEDRGGYYDGSGALRDMVQNHLLQVVATIAMEPPAKFDADDVRNETVKVFQSLQSILPEQIEKSVVRGQYTQSTIRGANVKGYREEKNVRPESRTETFVALKFYLDNWRWGGVPFYIRTGKRLPTRVTEVVIHFRKTPHYLFTKNNSFEMAGNKLIIRIQPDEGILLKFGMKMPGAGFVIHNVDMDFHYSDLGNEKIPSAYERLLYDCMVGDATLYARADAVESCWKFISPILKIWENNPAIKIYGYPAGTWGPQETSFLLEGEMEDWRYPCKNLANDGIYCEL